MFRFISDVVIFLVFMVSLFLGISFTFMWLVNNFL